MRKPKDAVKTFFIRMNIELLVLEIIFYIYLKKLNFIQEELIPAWKEAGGMTLTVLSQSMKDRYFYLFCFGYVFLFILILYITFATVDFKKMWALDYKATSLLNYLVMFGLIYWNLATMIWKIRGCFSMFIWGLFFLISFCMTIKEIFTYHPKASFSSDGGICA